MLARLMRLSWLEDMDIIPVVVSPYLPNDMACRKLMSIDQGMADMELDRHIGKVRLLYSDMVFENHFTPIITPDEQYLEVDIAAENINSCLPFLKNWTNRSMLKFIKRILPLDDVKEIPFPIPESMFADEMGKEFAYDEAVRYLIKHGIDETTAYKVSLYHVPGCSPISYFRRIFIVDTRLVEIRTDDLTDEDQVYNRMIQVRDWWMLYKLSEEE